MKKLVLLLIYLLSLNNLSAQTWVNIVDSSQYFIYFNSQEVDTISNTLYLGGVFSNVNDIDTKAIVRFNGTKFDSLESGLDYNSITQPPVVRCLKMFQNKLYVSGTFDHAGKYIVNNFARWTGLKWDSTDFKLSSYGLITSMTIFNNELYVAGIFDSIGGIKSPNLAKYDGINWYSVGQSYREIRSIESYNGTLYKIEVDSVGSPCFNLKYFNGGSWTQVQCISDPYTQINGMKVIDSLLFIYGKFNSIGGITCRGLASWNGNQWRGYDYGGTMGSFTTGQVRDIAKVNGYVYACGVSDSISNSSVTNIGIAKFDGNKWCTIVDPISGVMNISFEYNNDLYFGGGNLTIGSSSAIGLVKWIGGDSTLICGNFVGIDEISFKDDIKVYPNPTASTLSIICAKNQLDNSTIKIQNYLGQVVFTSHLIPQINISDLSAGIYFLFIDNKRSIKVIKQ